MTSKSLFTGYFLICITLITLQFSSCTNNNHHLLKNNVNLILDSLQEVYAPDKRIALWNIEIREVNDSLILSGETNIKKAFDDADSIIKKNYPQVVNKIKLLPVDEDQQIVTGLINNSTANLRSQPKHSAELVSQTLLGTPVKILDYKHGWYLLQIPNRYIAWTDAPAVKRINKEELKKYRESKKIVYNKQCGFSYSEPDVNSQTITDLVLGCILPVVSSHKDFYEVQYPDKRSAWVKKDEVIDLNKLVSRQIKEDELVKTGRKFLGAPYLWGGNSSKAIDCSGFSAMIYYMSGILLQRDASQQYKYGKIITTDYDYKYLIPGDLLFFGKKATKDKKEKVEHVAMYIGNTEFIHASGRVKINSIDSTRENFLSRYPGRFIRAIRVKGKIDGTGIERMKENDFYKQILKQD